MSTDQGNIPAVHTLEGLPVSCYRKWLRGRWEDQAKKAPARRALDVYEAVADRDMLTESEIAPILDAARSPYFVAWDIGMQLLCKLGGRHRVAHEAMRNLMEAGKATLRGRVLGALHDRLPKELCLELARRGLCDTSKRVRQTAAHVCRCLLLAEMLPELNHAATIERDPDAKFDMEYAIGLIRDGYFLYCRDDGSQAFVVRTSDGYPAELLYPGPAWVTPADIEERGAKAVAEYVRRQCAPGDWRPFRWDAETGS